MTDHEVLRRLARDHWVRTHGTPRLTVLVGRSRARTLWMQWSALAGVEAPIVEPRESLDVERAIEQALREPARALAILLQEKDLEDWRRSANDRSRTLVDEGHVFVPDVGTATTTPATSAPDLAQSARASTQQGPSDDGAQPSGESSRPSNLLDARSLAEAVLFDALEATASTRGRFELNGYLSVRFGADAAEVDLLNRRDRIAVEIDGYHHFTDADAYRRDRRKDVLLQSQGLFVIRLLAEDVVRDPTSAVNMVCQAMAFRLEPR